ncbi:MAG: site-2 protease family protein [Dehalococcoidia bacterium]
MRGNIRLGSLLGIPILVNPSWFILFGLVTWLLAVDVYPSALEDRGRTTHIIMAAVSALAFFACIVLHELAHSIVAKLYSIPVRSITLFLIGGVAQITREARKPAAELYMAAAGPLTSLVLGAAFLGVWWALGSGDTPVDYVLVWLSLMNVVLGVFNFLPAFPMDGGRVFRSLIWMVSGNYNRSTSIAGWTGRGIAWAMMGLGFLGVLGVDAYLVSDAFGGLWIILIGLFLENAARQSLFQNKVFQKLGQYTAKDLMLENPPTIDISATIGNLSSALGLNPRLCWFVERDGRLAGLLSLHEMRKVPQERWADTTAAEAMIPSTNLKPTTLDATASDILLEMENSELTHLPVVEDGRVIGVVGRDRIVGVLSRSGLLPA